MTDNSQSMDISMLEFLSEVTSCLNELTESNRRLLTALKEYQNLLVSNNTPEIERATPRIDRIAGEIRIIDEKRRAYVDEYFTSRGWDGPRNFSAIVSKVSANGVTDEEAAMFERASIARMELIEVLARVDAQNSLNLTLIGQGMSFAELSLKALLGLDRNPTTYGPSEPDDDGPSLLDAQA